LPIVLLLYTCSPNRMKNMLLLLASLLFYAWGEPVYIVLIIAATIADYCFGLLLDKSEYHPVKRKIIFTVSILVNLGVLGFFKYVDFVIVNVNELIGTTIPLLKLPLPIGISFYTFQSISYIVDVYRREVRAQRSWLDFATYIS